MKKRWWAWGALGLLALLSPVVLRFDLPAEEVDARHRVEASRFVTLRDGTRLHYQEYGEATLPTLLLLHGSYDSSFSWEGVIPKLQDDLHVIAPDLPAHGLTGKTVADEYNVPGAMATLRELTRSLGIERLDIAGNSFGGNIAWRYALSHPEQVRRVALIDAAGFPGGASLTPRSRFPPLQWLLRNGNPMPVLRYKLRQAVADPDLVVTDALLARWVDFIRREGTRDAQGKRRDTRDLDGQPVDALPTLQQPTLVLWGRRDALIPVADAERFHAALPNSELRIWDDVGHMPQLEVPERTADALRGFLLGEAEAEAGDAGVADAGTADAGSAD